MTDDSEQQRARRAGLAAGAGLALILVAYVALVYAFLQPRAVISNLDFWYHVGVGQQAQWDQPQTLVNGLYPIGYPLLLRLAITLGVDALRFGQALSVLGGALALAALFALLWRSTSRVSVASAGAVLLGLNPHFLQFATYEGNDMLAAGLQACALFCLWQVRQEAGGLHASARRWLVAAGILLGLGYLTRYTALISLPIALLYLIVVYRRSPPALVRAGAYLMTPLALVSAVQWLPSWLFYGDPVYNIQAKNVWFGIYGNNDWVANWRKVPDTIALGEVVRMDPLRFARHWGDQLALALFSLRLWPTPLHVTWFAALAAVLALPRLPGAQRLLLLLSVVLPVAATAMAWAAPRFLLLLLWLQALVLVLAVFYIATALLSSRRARLAAVALFVGLSAAVQLPGVTAWWRAPVLERPLVVHSFLRAAGMTEANQAATNDPTLHAVDDVARTRYAQVTDVLSSPPSVEALLSHPQARDWRYLVLDYEHGFGDYTRLRTAFRESKRLLAPLMLSEARDIFCVLPCDFADVDVVDVQFGAGPSLHAYRLQQTQDGGTLYLYWQTDRALERSYKVSVRLRDASGAERVQIDNVPQLWTFPTTAWPVDETIVDFYAWEHAQPCAGCQPGIVLYDAETLEPLPAFGEDGAQVGPVVPLAR